MKKCLFGLFIFLSLFGCIVVWIVSRPSICTTFLDGENEKFRFWITLNLPTVYDRRDVKRGTTNCYNYTYRGDSGGYLIYLRYGDKRFEYYDGSSAHITLANNGEILEFKKFYTPTTFYRILYILTVLILGRLFWLNIKNSKMNKINKQFPFN